MAPQHDEASHAPFFKYGMTANISAGDVILEEDLWLWSFRSLYHAKLCCNYCFQDAGGTQKANAAAEINLKKCSACKIAHYCSKECQQNDWKIRHKHECGFYQHFSKDSTPNKHWKSAGCSGENIEHEMQCAQVLLAMASKAVSEMEQTTNDIAANEILTAFRKMPVNSLIKPEHIVDGKDRVGMDKFVINQIDMQTTRHVQPALMDICAGSRITNSQRSGKM